MGELVSLVKSLYSQAPAATQSVACLSLLLAGFGIILAYVRGVYLHLVTKKLRVILGSSVPATIGLPTAEVEKTLDDKWGEMLELSVPRAFRYALHRMARARNRPVGLPEEAWRSAYELILADESRWETLVRGIASGAVLVGLFGTILGFADILSGLMLVPGQPYIQSVPATKPGGQAADPDQSKSIANVHKEREDRGEGLQSKLAGVFIATLSGIFGTLLILLGGAPFLRSVADRWLGTVEDAGRLVIVPALPRPPTRIQDTLLEELQRRISTVASAWEASLRGPAASLAEAADNSRRSVDAATKALDGLRVSVDDLKELGKSATRIRAAAQSIEETAKVYVNASKELGAAVRSLEVILPALTGDLKTLESRLEGLEGVLISGTRSVTESGDTLREGIAKMGSDFHGLREAVTSRHERESAFLEHTERVVRLIEEQLNGLTAVEQEIKVQAREMNTAVASVGLAVGRSLDPLRGTIAGAIRETFSELLRDYVDGLAAAVSQIRQESAAIVVLLDKIRSGQEGLVMATGEITTRASILMEQSRGLDHVAERVGAVLSTLDRLSEVVGNLAQSGVVARIEPEFLAALRQITEDSRTSTSTTALSVSELATLLAQVRESLLHIEEGISRFGDLIESRKRDSFFQKTWARLRRAARGRLA